MKNRLNKKGFTLVELLAVVVILLAISVIAITSISAALERQNDKKDKAIESIIKDYAKLYADDYKNTLNVGENCVNVSDLVDTYNLDKKTLLDSNGNDLSEGSVTFEMSKTGDITGFDLLDSICE